MDIHFFDTADEKHIRKEKEKARELRRKQWWRGKVDQGICHYCGRQFPPEEITMDHIVPIARGGTSTKGNVVPACKECNSKKKYLLPMEWEEYLNGFKDKENIDDRQRDQS
ncbi:HNH endonuclease [Geovibrio sp. ADMFC3]|nr:HNH endonuclease [Deferribacteraceae bacterium]